MSEERDKEGKIESGLENSIKPRPGQEAGQSKTSRFVTLPGLGVLLFFAVLAIYFRAQIVGAFLCFFFLLCFSSWFWSRGILHRIRLEAEAGTACCHAGGTLSLKLKVRNLSIFPLVWLDVILPVGKKELLKTDEDGEVFWFVMEHGAEALTGIRERFVWLLWQQEITWEETLVTLRRGWTCMTEASLQAGDGFGLSAQGKRYPLPKPVQLVVYPRLMQVNAQPFLKMSHEAAARNRGQQEDVTILKGSRPYTPGDSVKRINWRRLAMSGQMEIKLYETVMPGCAAFILDLESFHRMVKRQYANGSPEELVPEFQPEEMETMISLIASVVREISEHGIPSALIIPAYTEHEAVMVMPTADGDDLTRCMEALARVDYEGKKTIFPWEEFWQITHLCGDIYICSMNEKMAGYEEISELLGAGKVHRMILNRRGADTGACLYVDEILTEAAGRRQETDDQEPKERGA